MLIDLVVLISQVIRIHRIIIVLVKDIQQRAISTSQRVYTLDEEGVMLYPNLDCLAELWTR